MKISIAKSPTHPSYKEARHELTFVRSVCNGQESFAKHFGFAFKRANSEVKLSENDTISGDHQDKMMDFLIKVHSLCLHFAIKVNLNLFDS